MRRNNKLMHNLLDACAAGTALNANDKGQIAFDDEAFTVETIKYHLGQLEEGGFIKHDPNAKKDPMGHLRDKKAVELGQYHVTPKGHDRLDEPSDSKRWS